MVDTRDRKYYIDGSTVRKLETQAMPVEPERKVLEEPVVRKNHFTDRRWIDELKYSMFLTLAVAAAVGLCFYILKLNADIKAEKNNIKNLQAQLDEQLNLNAEYSSGLENMTDLEEIYQTATQELGMVYSEPGQTVYYSKNSDDYVVQYKDIPEAN